jgi:hypothetical protein
LIEKDLYAKSESVGIKSYLGCMIVCLVPYTLVGLFSSRQTELLPVLCNCNFMDFMAGKWFSKIQYGGNRCYFQCEGISSFRCWIFCLYFLNDKYLH